MSQNSAPSLPRVPTRPYLLDYFFLLCGFALSLYLMELHPLTIEPLDSITSPFLRGWIEFLPRLLRLPEGVILLFPLFFLPQFILGRRQEISSGEWLWILAWFGTVTLTTLTLVRAAVGLPDVLVPYLLTVRWIWHLGFGAALALLAVLMGLYGLIRRAPLPWTHNLGLVLMVWPILPLAGILLLKK